MTKAAQAVMDDALALPPIERATIIEGLISSFDPTGRVAIDQAWAIEAESRIDAYESGLLKAKSLKSIVRRVNQT